LGKYYTDFHNGLAKSLRYTQSFQLQELNDICVVSFARFLASLEVTKFLLIILCGLCDSVVDNFYDSVLFM